MGAHCTQGKGSSPTLPDPVSEMFLCMGLSMPNLLSIGLYTFYYSLSLLLVKLTVRTPDLFFLCTSVNSFIHTNARPNLHVLNQGSLAPGYCFKDGEKCDHQLQLIRGQAWSPGCPAHRALTHEENCTNHSTGKD